jgi:hypothetical protein
MIETAGGSIEPGTIESILRSTVSERQALRRSDAGRAELEANRKAIVYWQSRLARALIDARRRVD